MYPPIHSHPNQTNQSCAFSRLTSLISAASDTQTTTLLIRALQGQGREIARRHVLIINRDRPWRGLPLPVRASLRTTANHQFHFSLSILKGALTPSTTSSRWYLPARWCCSIPRRRNPRFRDPGARWLWVPSSVSRYSHHPMSYQFSLYVHLYTALPSSQLFVTSVSPFQKKKI
jgi:hypothetical protein